MVVAFNRVFHELDEIGNIGTETFLRDNLKKSSNKMLPAMRYDLGTSVDMKTDACGYPNK